MKISCLEICGDIEMTCRVSVSPMSFSSGIMVVIDLQLSGLKYFKTITYQSIFLP